MHCSVLGWRARFTRKKLFVYLTVFIILFANAFVSVFLSVFLSVCCICTDLYICTGHCVVYSAVRCRVEGLDLHGKKAAK